MSSKGYALARAELIRVLTAYSGITTADGLPGGTTLVDINLKDNPSISEHAIPEKAILIMSGDAVMEDKGAASFVNATGTITLQGTGFSAQIKKGTIFRILNISSVEIDVADIDTKIGTNVDAAGTTTLFAWMANLLAAIGAIAGIDAYVEQIPDTDVNETVTDTEADCVLVNLAYVLARTYCLRHLRLKCADPGARTVTIRLYERWNDAIAQLIDSFDIDAANWGTYHNLVDIFSIPEIHSDAILIRAVHDGASPGDDVAIEVTYRYAQANS